MREKVENHFVCNGIGTWFGKANEAYNKHAGVEYKVFPYIFLCLRGREQE
jgi:hypothetical protein